MALSQDIKERIFAAADALHAASETGEFPSVEAVRQESRAGMNNVVEAMKEWRQNQRKQVQAVREPLPVELHGVVQSMGQSLWETAQQLANESLDAAKAAFETEKSDLIQLSAEQSEAFEAQAAELDAAQARIAELERQATAAAAAAQATAQELDETRRARLAAEQDAALAKQRAEEIERRAAELRAELDHAGVVSENG
jgi:Plasmid replication region DNA-binding N-term.